MTAADMPDDLRELIPLQALPDILPLNTAGKKYHPSQPYRWAKKGLLRVVKVGSVMYTHRDWVDAYLNREARPTLAPRMTRRCQERELDRIDAELAAKGR